MTIFNRLVNGKWVVVKIEDAVDQELYQLRNIAWIQFFRVRNPKNAFGQALKVYWPEVKQWQTTARDIESVMIQRGLDIKDKSYKSLSPLQVVL